MYGSVVGGAPAVPVAAGGRGGWALVATPAAVTAVSVAALRATGRVGTWVGHATPRTHIDATLGCTLIRRTIFTLDATVIR